MVCQGDKFVLVQESLLAKKGYFNLPAGTLEVEENLQACLIREVQEETGVTIVPESFLGVYQCVLGNGHNIILFLFSATIPSDAVFHSEEHAVIETLSYEEVKAYGKEDKLRSPVVLKAIEDYRGGQRLPLSSVQAWHLDDLPTIRVPNER